jgi:hypothetical protein
LLPDSKHETGTYHLDTATPFPLHHPEHQGYCQVVLSSLAPQEAVELPDTGGSSKVHIYNVLLRKLKILNQWIEVVGRVAQSV